MDVEDSCGSTGCRLGRSHERRHGKEPWDAALSMFTFAFSRRPRDLEQEIFTSFFFHISRRCENIHPSPTTLTHQLQRYSQSRIQPLKSQILTFPPYHQNLRV